MSLSNNSLWLNLGVRKSGAAHLAPLIALIEPGPFNYEQNPDKHAEGDDIPRYGRWRLGWEKIPGALKAYEVSEKLFDMLQKGRSSNSVTDFLRDTVYQFSPGAQDRKAGGTLDAYSNKKKTEKMENPRDGVRGQSLKQSQGAI